MERRYNNHPTKVETRADGKRYITGHGIVTYREGDTSTEYELFNEAGVRAVERVHPDFSARAVNDRMDVRGLVNHDPNKLLGRVAAGTMVLVRDDTGLRYDIAYNENDTDHRNTAERLERGDLDGSSFSFKAKAKWETLEDGTRVRWLMDGEVFDVGPVTYPAYQGTSAGMRAVGDTSDVQAEMKAWEAEQAANKRKALQVRMRLMELESQGA